MIEILELREFNMGGGVSENGVGGKEAFVDELVEI